MSSKSIKYIIALLIVLLLVGAPIYYYSNRVTTMLQPDNSMSVVSNDTIQSNVANEKTIKMNTIKPDSVLNDTGVQEGEAIKEKEPALKKKDISKEVDTVANRDKPTKKEIKEDHDYASETGTLTPVQDNSNLPMMEQPEPDANIVVGKSISYDNDIVCKKVKLRNNSSLMVYPHSGDWQQMFIMLPVASTNVRNPNTSLTRTFDGVTYPSTQKANILVHGKYYQVVILKVKGTMTNEERPFYVYLNNNPKFVIFGDFLNKNKWYIYENDSAAHYDAPADLK